MLANKSSKRTSLLLRVKNRFNSGDDTKTSPENSSRQDEGPTLKQASFKGPSFKGPSFKPRKATERGPPQKPRVPFPPSYAEVIPHNPREKISASEPRDCRTMLRELYALNIFIQNCSHVFEANIPIINEKKRRADAALMDLRQRVEMWMSIEGDWSEKEMQTIIEIHDLIKEMQPVPIPFNHEEEMSPSNRNDTASTVTSFA